MPVKPMLDGIELQQVQKIETDEDQVLTQHSVPALEGDFLQRLGRRATRVALTGVMTGAEVGTSLKTLRDKYRAGAAVSFVADIATATKVDQVLIEEFGVRELAGKTLRFEYELTLREMIPPPQPESEDPPPPPPPPPPPSVETGTLIVEVIVEDEPNFDFSTATVRIDGTQENGTPLPLRTLTNRENNRWSEEIPPGQYTARAVVTAPDPMSGETAGVVRAGQTTEVQIVLRRGVNIAKAFIIHFRFDNAFFEPCMREVLERVFAYAQAHPEEKIVVVGHTDKTGSDDYNQFLSERRARSVFGFMTFGSSPQLRQSAIDDWDQLRRGPHGGLNDSWGVREYQYMLQDLEFYTGNIDEKPGHTDAAVRDFQQNQGLPVTGIVDAATWRALVTAYLEAGSLAIAEGRFLPNANPEGTCNGGILRWVGCGERDPVRWTEDAWRPNRRVEILFTRENKLPCEEPAPVTLNLPAGTANNKWCLDNGNTTYRCCFIKPRTPEAEANRPPAAFQWTVLPAEPDRVVVNGTILFDDGTPYANRKYVLIAPDGKYLRNAKGADPAEVPRGATGVRGTPVPMKTDDQGNFDHPDQAPVGVYILELPGLEEPAVARANEEPPDTAIGNVICLHIGSPGGASAGAAALRDAGAAQTGSASSGATVHRSRPTPVPVNPVVTAASPVVVVKKPHTNPARLQITVQTDRRFRRSGTLTRTVTGAGGNIRFFTAAQGGTEITFNGTDNVFTGNELTAGIQLFAESDTPSGAPDDKQLTLTLAAGPTPVGPPASLNLTAVELTLDICVPRTSPAADPAPLSATDKINLGRFIQVATPDFSHLRAMLIIRPPNPLVAVPLALTPINARASAFTTETPAAGQTPLANPHTIISGIIPPNGARFFVEGTGLSGAARDTGYRLGIQGGESEADRVNLTAIDLGLTNNVAPFNTVIDRVQIEGILNTDRASFDLSDLIGNQRDSLFRVRAEIPGITSNTIQARLISRRSAGTEIESRDVTLNRTGGDRFVSSLPILAIPEAIPRLAIAAEPNAVPLTFKTPQDLEVIRCSAGGRLRMELAGTLAGLAARQGRVRGRLVHVFASAITGAGITEDVIRQEIRVTNRIWAQAGIEVRERGINASVADPGTLLDLNGFSITPFTGTLTAEEQALLALNRSAVNSDVNIYYVRSIDNGAAGEGISSDEFAAVTDPTGSGIILMVTAFNTNQAHELGHLLVHNGDEHRVAGVARPAANLMHPFTVAGRRDLDSGQVLRAIRVGNSFVTSVE